MRLAHTLKGSASTVGALRVQAAAAALEAALADPAGASRVADCLTAVGGAVAALRDHLASETEVEDPPPPRRVADPAAARADLTELEPLLRRHRLVGEPLLTRLRDHLGDHAAARELDPLMAQIRAFDFSQALETLQRLAEKLRPNAEGLRRGT